MEANNQPDNTTPEIEKSEIKVTPPAKKVSPTRSSTVRKPRVNIENKDAVTAIVNQVPTLTDEVQDTKVAVEMEELITIKTVQLNKKNIKKLKVVSDKLKVKEKKSKKKKKEKAKKEKAKKKLKEKKAKKKAAHKKKKSKKKSKKK